MKFQLGLLIVLCALAHLPALFGGYVWDDDKYVTRNPLLSAEDGLFRIWFSLDSPSQYFPLTYTSFWVEHRLWGLHPLGYHLNNVLLHIMNGILVFVLFKRLKIPGAWMAAALFSLHPVQVESVAWITERKNLLMFFFSGLSLMAWIAHLEKENKGSYLLSLGLFALALFGKTTACVLPAALVLILVLKRIPIRLKHWLKITPYLFLGLAMGLLAMWWEEHHQGTDPAALNLDIWQRLLIASRALWFYAYKLVWPFDLCFSYPAFNPNDQVLWFGLCLAVFLLLFLFRKKIPLGVIVGLVFFAAALFPMLGFFSLYTFFYTYVADHYQYMACLGLLGIMAAGLHGVHGKNKRIGQLLCAGILLFLGTQTFMQSRIYKDRETLWRDVIEKSPQSWMAFNNLGLALEGQARFEEAIDCYQRAAKLKPDHVEPLNNLGNSLSQVGRFFEARSALNKALNLRGNDATTLTNLGNVHLKEEALKKAEACYKKALALNPKNAKAHYNYGILYLKRGDPKNAAACFAKALEMEPGYGLAQKQLDQMKIRKSPYEKGLEHARAKEYEKARHFFEMQLTREPQNLVCLKALANCLTNLNRFKAAEAAFKKALALEPENPNLHYKTALVLDQQGKTDAAVNQYKEVLRLNPNHAKAKKRLRVLLNR